MHMRLAVDVRLDLSFANFVALAEGIGLEFGPVHGAILRQLSKQ
jgi:hypothetical protein